MEDLFKFEREKTIKILIEQSQSYSHDMQKRINVKIARIEELKNFRQLLSYIDKKLIKYHGILKHNGVDHNQIKKKLVNYKGNTRLVG